MSEGPDGPGPGPDASASAEPASAETASAETETSPPGRWSRVLPSWARRRPLLTGLAAGILAAAVITGVVFLIARPWAPQPRYTSLPLPGGHGQREAGGRPRRPGDRGVRRRRARC